METHHINTGKIVSSPTDTTWAQAYSAGKLYTVLSLEGSVESGLAALGKETIEKLQREFFALDNKSLTAIKKSVETVIADIPKDISYSFVLATVVDSVVYLVLAGLGHVVLKRGDKTSNIAAGEDGQVTTFSGKFEPQDIFLLETDSFLKTISMDKIKTGLEEKTPHEISENLALVMHEKSTGLEAGLVIHLGGHHTKALEEVADSHEATDSLPENNDHLELDDSPKEKKKHALPVFNMPNISHLMPRKFSKKQLIAVMIVALLLILGSGIFIENNKRQETKYNAEVTSLLAQHNGRYEEAVAVMGLNKSLAVEELMTIKTALVTEQKNYPQGSAARLKLDDFLAKVNDALGGNVPNSNSPISVFFEPQEDLKIVAFLTNKGGTLTSAGGTTAGSISNNGAIDKTYETNNAKGISASEDNIFIMTSNSVQKISKDTGKADDIFDVSGAISMDTFGDNVYVLEEKTINKYRPNAYTKEAYFTGEETLSDPSSIAIDSSIYVVDDSKIRKFTRGKEDSFSYSGPTLSNKSLAYTDEDYANLYVVDPTSKMAYVIDKSGNKVSEISLKGMRTITGIAANEKDKKIFIASDNKIYSINF